MFQPKAFYWQTFVVVRRVAFIAINLSIVALPSLKYFLFVLLHLVSLVCHLIIRPYRNASLNTIETMTLSILVVLATLLTAFPSPEIADDTSAFDSTALQLSITLLIGMPVLAFIVYGIARGIMMYTSKSTVSLSRLVDGLNSSASDTSDISMRSSYRLLDNRVD
jgi:hypothetical protein